LQVPAGTYSITTSAANFATERSEDVHITLGRATTADVKLQAGGVSASVVVTAADTAAIDVSSNRIQTNITTDVINSTPRGTRVDSVLQLSGATRQEPLSRGYQVDGSSGAENTFVIDGSEVTNFRTGQLRDTNNIPFQFVQEVQIKSSGFDAEFGGATGGVINVVTKSGGNQFHGDFGMQFETSSLSARQTLTGKIANSDPQYQANPLIQGTSAATLSYINPRGDTFLNTYPSGTISGPILKNRLWFLVSAAHSSIPPSEPFCFPPGKR
jgi:outer membrane receptor for ferrienterochelin and colicin